jgi:phospholipid transport system substrate-binding protein
MTRHWLSLGALSLTLGFLAMARPGMAAPNPAALLGNLAGTGYIQVLGSNVRQEQHLASVRELFSEDFDIPEMGRFVLGRYWSEMTPEQQQEFLSLFEEYTVRAYSARLSQFGGTLFGVTGTQRNGDEMVVTSEAIRADDPPVRIDWHLINRAGRYKITDVSVDGVSMKAAQRDAFASVIQNSGGRADAVLAVLRQELADAR